jgi:iodotyrosine deiodinase
MPEARFVPLENYQRYPESEMLDRAKSFRQDIQRRRTVRDFSDEPVPEQVLIDCLATAASAPSGANMQPWHFVVVRDSELKRRIRLAAEQEEREFYEHRASAEWLEALRPLGTDANKAFLERAPVLIAVFSQKFGLLPDGRKVKHYYPTESVGLATGFLLAALQHAGLASLTHTPSPMGFLNDILERPGNERPFLLLVVGYPADTATVPDIKRKDLSEVMSAFG